MFNKKITLIILAAMIITPAFLFSSETSSMWIRLYKRFDTLEYKLDIMKNIVEEDSRDIIPLLTDALNESNQIKRQLHKRNTEAIF